MTIGGDELATFMQYIDLSSMVWFAKPEGPAPAC